MEIETKGSPTVSGVKLRPGKHNYNIDHKDPLTAIQLHALKEVGLIEFGELVNAKPAMEALDDPEQDLKIDYVKTRDDKGRVLSYEYMGSKIMNPEAEKKAEKEKSDGHIGGSPKDTAPTVKVGKDGNSDKSGRKVPK